MTLMEILVVISILAIFSSIALPAADEFMVGYRITAVSRAFLADVRLARYEAIRTQQVHRLVLTDLSTGNRFKVERFVALPEEPPESYDSNDNANWNSILEELERELPADVMITANLNSTVYFTPDGLLVDNWSTSDSGMPLLPRTVNFNCDDIATMTVQLSAHGGVSSTAVYEEYY